MINRLKFLDQEHWIEEEFNTDKLEILICLESVSDVCYQILAGLTKDEAMRKECRRFEQYTEYRREELRRIFLPSSASEMIIQSKVAQCLIPLRSPHLAILEVFDLAVSLTAYKIDIYKYFFRMEQGHNDLLNDCVQDSKEEMNFLRQERKFYQNNSGGSIRFAIKNL